MHRNARTVVCARKNVRGRSLRRGKFRFHKDLRKICCDSVELSQHIFYYLKIPRAELLPIITWRHTDLLLENSGKIIHIIDSACFRNILDGKGTCIKQVEPIFDPLMVEIIRKTDSDLFFEQRRKIVFI